MRPALPFSPNLARGRSHAIKVAAEYSYLECSMNVSRDEDDLFDEVMETHEESHPHRREHAKADPRPDEEELARKTNVEREEVGLPEDE
jgi:hypothetical protein